MRQPHKIVKKTIKQVVGKLPTNCLSVFDIFVGLALKGLIPVSTLELLVINSTLLQSLLFI